MVSTPLPSNEGRYVFETSILPDDFDKVSTPLPSNEGRYMTTFMVSTSLVTVSTPLPSNEGRYEDFQEYSIMEELFQHLYLLMKVATVTNPADVVWSDAFQHLYLLMKVATMLISTIF